MKGWKLVSTVGDTRTYLSKDGKIEMTIRPDGLGAKVREFAIVGKPRERFLSEEAARERL